MYRKEEETVTLKIIVWTVKSTAKTTGLFTAHQSGALKYRRNGVVMAAGARAGLERGGVF